MAGRAARSQASSQSSSKVSSRNQLPDIYETLRRSHGSVTLGLFWTYLHENRGIAEQRSLLRVVEGENYMQRICKATGRAESDQLQVGDLNEMNQKVKAFENELLEELPEPRKVPFYAPEPVEELRSSCRHNLSLIQEQQPPLTRTIISISQGIRSSQRPSEATRKEEAIKQPASDSISPPESPQETSSPTKHNYPSLGHGKDPDFATEGLYMDTIRKRNTVELEAQRARRIQLDQYLKAKNKAGIQANAAKQRTKKKGSTEAKLSEIYEKIAGKEGKSITLEQFGDYIRTHSQDAEQFRVLEFTSREDFLPFLSQATGRSLSSPLASSELRMQLRALRHYRAPAIAPFAVSSAPFAVPSAPFKPSHILLNDSLLDVLFSIFRQLDKDDEQYITREDFVTHISENAELQENKDEVAYETTEGPKTFGEVMQAIENDGDQLEYLSLSDLKDYLGFNYEEKHRNSDLGKVMLEKDAIRAIYSAFQSSLVEGEVDTATTEAFLAAMRSGAAYEELKDKVAREPLGLSKFPKETVEEVMQRLGESEGETLAWNVILAYLTVRGEPGMYETQDEEHVEEQREESMWESSSDSSESQISEAQSSNIEEKPKLTVPEGPSFLARPAKEAISERKVLKMYEESAQKEAAELQIRPKPLKVPASVSQPRYYKLLLQEEKRKEETLRSTMALEQAKANPPSVAFKALSRPVEGSPPVHVFVAHPVPEASAVLLMDKLQDEEEMRKIRARERAEKKLDESQMPPRMAAAQQKQSHVLDAVEKKTLARKTKSVPDFNTLQTRFQLQLQAELQIKKVTTPEPFLLSAPRPCTDIPPVTTPTLPLAISTLPQSRKKQAREERIKQTVLNAMESESSAGLRRAHNTESEEVFTHEQSTRIAHFKASIESLSS